MATVDGYSVRTVALAGAAGVAVSYYAISKYVNYARFKRKEAAAGALPVFRIPTKYPFGLDIMLDNINHIKKKTFRDYLIERSKTYGETYHLHMMGTAGEHTSVQYLHHSEREINSWTNV